MAKLGDIASKFQSGGTPSKTEEAYFHGNIPWITTVALNGKTIDENDAVDWITDKAIAESAAKIVPAFSLMIGTRVGVGKVAVNTVPMSTSQDIISLVGIDEKKWNKAYLCRFIQSKSAFLNGQARGATIKGIKADVLTALEVPSVEIAEQNRIATVFDELDMMISLRKQQLAKLDELVKARFVEMFGDPVLNDKNWPVVPLASLAEIKIGPFGSLLHKEDYITGCHALVNPSHIMNGKVVPDDNLTLTDKKYREMKTYHLHIGDIVLGRRGEMGRCAVVYNEGMLCGTGSLIIRPSEKMHPYFLQRIISYPTFRKSIEDMAVGVTMMNLNVPIVSSFMIPVLPLENQITYLGFIKQIDQLMLTIQQGLNKLEFLKKALMQRYFC